MFYNAMANVDYIVAMSDFVKSTEIVWLIVVTCAVPLLSLSLLTIFIDEILARWYATTVFKLKNLKQTTLTVYKLNNINIITLKKD